MCVCVWVCVWEIRVPTTHYHSKDAVNNDSQEEGITTTPEPRHSELLQHSPLYDMLS